jgi:hypothetical protein
MTDFPDQRRLWDAYGHAMGAIAGVELLLRIALINRAVSKMVADGDLTEGRKSAELAKIQQRTLGATVGVFKTEFPNFGDDAAFCDSIDNAVRFRNSLAHHFVENHLLAFRSDEGIDLATLECIEHTEHFQSLDDYIRRNCAIDFDAFFQLGEGKADEYTRNHPLRTKLQAIKEGSLDQGNAS